MTTEVRVPQLPESVADATLVAWHKKVGETVARDENLADLETDKVVLEVPAPVAGVIKSLDKTAGTTVTSGELLAVIEEQASAAAAPKAPRQGRGQEAGSQEARRQRRQPRPQHRRKTRLRGKLSPAARRLVEENKLSADQIAGSGRDGRISQERRCASPRGSADAARRRAAGGRVEQRVPMSRLRARIAQRLVEAQATRRC